MIDVSKIPANEPVRVIIGAGTQSYPGWIATQREQLDLLRSADWAASFGERLVDAFLCEHVWEHLTEAEGRFAASLCFTYLQPGGYLRCAVLGSEAFAGSSANEPAKASPPNCQSGV